MKNIDQSLTLEEMNVLEHFMLYRTFDEVTGLDEERAYDENIDEGIYSIYALDGFITAMVSGPVTISPSRWLPELWGDEEPFFESEDEFKLFSSLIMRHMNDKARTLVEQAETFYPLFESNEVDGKTVFSVEQWCLGYMRAVKINEPLWLGQSMQHDEYLESIRGFTEEVDWQGYDLVPIVNGEERAEVVWHAAYFIHQYWLSMRQDLAPQTSEPKIGRNEPCPCGSGKKFKKCCMH